MANGAACADETPAAPVATESQPAANPFTANLSAASQYVFRGLTQTGGKPAVQGGADYAAADGTFKGIYLGTWLSNISWYGDQNAGTVSAPVALSAPGSLGPPYFPGKTNSAHVEWDLYGGYKRQVTEDWSYDVGTIFYQYPGRYDNTGAYRKPDTVEVYLGVTWKWFTLKYSKGVSHYSFGTNESRGASYADISASYPIMNSGVTLLLHAGRQTYPDNPNFGYFGNSGGNNTFYSYSDYKIALSKDWQGFTFGAAFTHAATKSTAPDNETTAYFDSHGNNIGGSRFAVTVSRTF